MAGDLTVTAAQVAAVFSDPGKAEIYDFVAGATITKGEAVYVDSNGVLQLTIGGATGTAQCIGISLTGGGTGAAISVLHHGCMYGFTLTDTAYYGLVYTSDGAGVVNDNSSGAVDTIVGRCWPLSDNDLTKVLMVDCNVQHVNYT